MSAIRPRRRRRAPVLAAGLLAMIGVAGALVWRLGGLEGKDAISLLPRTAARRADLHVTLRAGGQVASASNIEIECELESVSVNSEGRSFSARGASTIIELLPEGSSVKKGDVLCRFDASEFEELLRQQEIRLLEARADSEKAKLDLKAATIAVEEFREGTKEQEEQELQGQKTLAQVDIERQRDRIAWAEKMVRNLYLSEGQLIRERQLLLRSEISLARIETQIRSFLQFQVPMTMTRLEAAVERARIEVSFQQLRQRRREEQLAKLRQQVERCTIRAPHDGILTYATDDDDPPIELGITVHENMDLFLLPDLEKMEVRTVLHETVIDRVEEGMTARVHVEAMPDYELEGQVVSLSPLPIMDRNRRASSDIKNYLARVQLLTVPPSLKPGMSAEVEIVTAHHPQALVIPVESVTVEAGQEYCYVAGDEVVERRPVAVRSGTVDLLHVESGLEEGEEVVLTPDQIGPDVRVIESPADSQAIAALAESTVDSIGLADRTASHDTLGQ